VWSYGTLLPILRAGKLVQVDVPFHIPPAAYEGPIHCASGL
jgi:hypothetical protein